MHSDVPAVKPGIKLTKNARAHVPIARVTAEKSAPFALSTEPSKPKRLTPAKLNKECFSIRVLISNRLLTPLFVFEGATISLSAVI